MWKIHPALVIILSTSLSYGCMPNKAETEPFFTINENYISNFKFGMVCPNPEGKKTGEETRGIGSGTICNLTDEIFITGGQTCIYNRQPINCTWYGYEFEFQNIPTEAMDCKFKSSIPIDNGNPREILVEESDYAEVTVELEGKEGRFYNPLYSGFVKNEESDIRIQMQTLCFYQDDELFSLKYTVIHPTN